MAEGSDGGFIFLDVQGRRWPRMRRILLIASLLVFLAVVVFIGCLCVKPQLHLPNSVRQLQTRLKALQKEDPAPPLKATKPLWLEFAKPASAAQPHNEAAIDLSVARPRMAGEIKAAFYLNGDQSSFDSFKAHKGSLTHVCVEWLTLADGLGTLVVRPDQKLLALLKGGGPVFMLVLNNLIGDSWQPEAVEGLANGPAAGQERFLDELVPQLTAMGAGGLVVDWGQLDPMYAEQIAGLLKRMAVALHRQGMELWLCVPMGEELRAFDLELLAPEIDRFVATLHDENSENDPPGPIASLEWFNGWLEAMMDYGEPQQWVVGIGAYGYDWTQGEHKAEVLRFPDIMSRAGRSGTPVCKSEAPFYNPSFFYEDEGSEHRVWFLDASSFLNQLQVARNRRVGGIAISDLGYEDPAIWYPLELPGWQDLHGLDLQPLQELKATGTVTHVGRGEFLTLDDAIAGGARKVTVDGAGNFVSSYDRFPSYLTLCHQGPGNKDQVAISFDDGPDPKWTPRILDILKAKKVKASFFVVGMRMEAFPEIVRRIVAEGHEIGVHTYTHPNLAVVSEERALLELNATQRLLETITGRSTILFRPPYNADSRPYDPAEIIPIKLAQQLGYLTVTENIDPEDWMRPGVAVMLERVKQERRRGGNIILLHDAGGDRSQTLAALPAIIDYLQDRGDAIVSLSEMLEEAPDYLMPPFRHDEEKMMRMVTSSGFRALHGVEGFLWAFMITATALTALRSLVIALLACRRKEQTGFAGAALFHPPVSVILPAYNEEKVIGRTLSCLLQTRYPGSVEILVIDDGSRDRTAAIVSRMAAQDQRVRLRRQPNQGKASALRAGIEAASHEILVMLDADTQFQPETITHLVQPLRGKEVAAVSGHAKVGNPRTFIARCQALEYTCGFNLDRRAYHQLNCITVVPGAVSAMKRRAVRRVGGICADTLAEDTDLTLSFHRAGFRVAYTADAVAWTEAPETFAALAKQRFRWAFGTLQCLWKHRDLVFNPRCGALGWFSLPGVWFFQILLVAIGPMVDGMLIASLLLGFGSTLLPYFITFLVTDVFLAALASHFEREPLRKSLLIIPMRFIYRPLLGWVIWKALFRAVQGAWVNWGKLERTASVPMRV